MIVGSVNPRLEAVVAVEIIGPAGKRRTLSAVVETGFNGFLSLPPETVNELELKHSGRARGTLASGRVEFFRTVQAVVEWDGRQRIVDVLEMEATPLLGMRFLSGAWLTVHCIDGGDVAIETRQQ